MVRVQELALYGVQRRNVTCRHICDTDSTSTVTPADACQLSADDDPPVTERLCRLPCPQDCVVTELGSWSRCCGGLQTRRRRVLVGPQHGGRACRAPMFESRRCDDQDDETCGVLAAQTTRRRPVYLVGQWSECEQPGDHHPIGRRYRPISCVDELGRPTELRYAPAHGLRRVNGSAILDGLV